MKYLSRKFILTLIALAGSLVYVFAKENPDALVIGAIAGVVGQYSASNAFTKEKQND